MARTSHETVKNALGKQWKEGAEYTLVTQSRLTMRKRAGYKEVGKLNARLGEELLILEKEKSK